MVQAVLSTYLSLDPPDIQTTKDWLLQDQLALEKYTQPSTRYFVEVELTKMVL
jgi:hypothetical protein